jgi:hypothetical protein
MPQLQQHRTILNNYFEPEALRKSGFGGEQTDSNQRLI